MSIVTGSRPSRSPSTCTGSPAGTPELFLTLPCPTYPEIRLSIAAAGKVGRLIDAFNPDALHIATEGPLGWAARRHARKRGIPFTTAYHTRFPEYVKARFG